MLCYKKFRYKIISDIIEVKIMKVVSNSDVYCKLYKKSTKLQITVNFDFTTFN